MAGVGDEPDLGALGPDGVERRLQLEVGDRRRARAPRRRPSGWRRRRGRAPPARRARAPAAAPAPGSRGRRNRPSPGRRAWRRAAISSSAARMAARVGRRPSRSVITVTAGGRHARPGPGPSFSRATSAAGRLQAQRLGEARIVLDADEQGAGMRRFGRLGRAHQRQAGAAARPAGLVRGEGIGVFDAPAVEHLDRVAAAAPRRPGAELDVAGPGLGAGGVAAGADAPAASGRCRRRPRHRPPRGGRSRSARHSGGCRPGRRLALDTCGPAGAALEADGADLLHQGREARIVAAELFGLVEPGLGRVFPPLPPPRPARARATPRWTGVCFLQPRGHDQRPGIVLGLGRAAQARSTAEACRTARGPRRRGSVAGAAALHSPTAGAGGEGEKDQLRRSISCFLMCPYCPKPDPPCILR